VRPTLIGFIARLLPETAVSRGLVMQSSSSGNAVFDKVILAVGQTVQVEGISLTSASRLVDDLRIGRLGRMRLAICLEEAFDIELPDDAVKRFDTVDDIVRYLSRW
jgi:acyl carrier protein